MKLEVITPAGAVVGKKVERVTLPGGGGAFTILRGHAPIVSTLLPGKVTWLSGGDEGELEIGGGLLHAEKETIHIYL